LYIPLTHLDNPSPSPLLSLFFFSSPGHHPAPHSFPTRRSSDLTSRAPPPTPSRGTASIACLTSSSWPGSTASASWRWRSRTSRTDRKSTRLNSSHVKISYAVFCLKKKKKKKKKKK